MSYNMIKVNELEPQSGNIEVSLASLVNQPPINGQLPKKQGGAWAPSSASGDSEPPVTTMFAHYADGVSYSPSAFPLDTTYWAYSWPNGTAVTQRLYGGTTLVNVGRPPSYLYSHNNWGCGVQLPAGDYLITMVPTLRTGAVTMQLYHTPTSSLTGTYFGNEIYFNGNDGKTATTLIGYLSITETRNVYPRVKTGSSTYFDTNSFQSSFWHVQRVA
jgi:hypothetical protein